MASSTPQIDRLQSFIEMFDISIAKPEELLVLEQYEIVVIVDDSGSMRWPANQQDAEQIGLPQISQITSNAQVVSAFQKMQSLEREGIKIQSRWDELQEALAQITELGAIFDKSGIDIFFLNRSEVTNCSSSNSRQFQQAFQSPPDGGTPLTETLTKVVKRTGGDKPVLLFIMTDGEPNDGKDGFCRVLRDVVDKKSTPHTFRVQIMACTGDEDAVGYLDDIDKEFDAVDVTDDYYSEKAQVMKFRDKFSRGDWCLKAMLGPVSAKFDAWDEMGQMGLPGAPGGTGSPELTTVTIDPPVGRWCACSKDSSGSQGGCHIS